MQFGFLPTDFQRVEAEVVVVFGKSVTWCIVNTFTVINCRSRLKAAAGQRVVSTRAGEESVSVLRARSSSQRTSWSSAVQK